MRTNALNTRPNKLLMYLYSTTMEYFQPYVISNKITESYTEIVLEKTNVVDGNESKVTITIYLGAKSYFMVNKEITYFTPNLFELYAQVCRVRIILKSDKPYNPN